MSDVEAYYCGSVREAGVYLFEPGLRRAKPPADWPFGRGADLLDAVYAPRSKRQFSRDEQPQGYARIVLVCGWTVLAFWDRSGADKRSGIHSTFVFRGTYTSEGALYHARETFPEIFARLTFDVKLEGDGWM